MRKLDARGQAAGRQHRPQVQQQHQHQHRIDSGMQIHRRFHPSDYLPSPAAPPGPQNRRPSQQQRYAGQPQPGHLVDSITPTRPASPSSAPASRKGASQGPRWTACGKATCSRMEPSSRNLKCRPVGDIRKLDSAVIQYHHFVDHGQFQVRGRIVHRDGRTRSGAAPAAPESPAAATVPPRAAARPSPSMSLRFRLATSNRHHRQGQKQRPRLAHGAEGGFCGCAQALKSAAGVHRCQGNGRTAVPGPTGTPPGSGRR